MQADPALALPQAGELAVAWRYLQIRGGRYARLIAVGLLALVAVGVWRVNEFPKLAEQTLVRHQVCARTA